MNLARHHPPSPKEIFHYLKAANEAFVEKQDPPLRPGERAPAEKQAPIASVLTCSDSRVSPELLFNQDFGDLFVVRLAGNLVGDLALETLEFGVQALRTPLLVILGHEDCGAVKAALKQPSGEAFSSLMEKILPATRSAQKSLPNLSGERLLKLAIEENIYNSYHAIVRQSAVIREAVREESLQIALGTITLPSKRIHWLPLKRSAPFSLLEKSR